MFKLNPNLNGKLLAEEFAERGRLSIGNFLDEKSAELLHQNVRQRSDWLEIFNNGEKLVELNREQQQGLSAKQKSDLADALHANARHGFQYRYETIRVPDAENARRGLTDPVTKFVDWLSCGEARDFLSNITGNHDIVFADGQATAYSPGHFLTGHDDDFAGKHRHAAYVFGLTPVWRIEWGGLLLFHENNGQSAEYFTPDFNKLNLFAVPQMHSVSEVTRSAAYRRYSITGWLRTRY